MDICMQIESLVKEQLSFDKSGHDIGHIIRVKNLAILFAQEESNVDLELIKIASLLHDVDDYKIVGFENSLKFINAKRIMNKVNLDKKMQVKVIEIIKNMGYKNALKGIRPTSTEGIIVSDADMCDAMGVVGIIRTITYAISSKGSGKVFDKNIFPKTNISYQEYNQNGTTHNTDTAINHIFEKMLKIPGLLLTNSGKLEGKKRSIILIQFLKELFREERLDNWQLFLDKYLTDIHLEIETPN